MSEDNNQVEIFSQFAKERLDNHLAELATRYENMTPSKELTREAFQNHKKIFEEELDAKMESFSFENDSTHEKEKIQELKQSFLDKLDQIPG